MDYIINYKDFDVDKLTINKNTILYNNDPFLLRTCYLTINSKLINVDNKFYIEFLTNDIINSQTNIFLDKMNQINDKIKEITGNTLLEINDNKIIFELNQHNLAIKTKFYVDGEYVDDFKNFLKYPNRASFIVLFDNINNTNTLEILEINIKVIEIPKQKMLMDESNDYQMSHRYDIVDKELDEIINILGD
jgi:hypothetical protein